MTQPLTATGVLRTLKRRYKPPRTFLRWRTPLDLLVLTILSAQCTDARVNLVSKTLFKKYKKPQDYLAVSRKELEYDVHSCGTYRVKAKYIHELCAALIERHNGKVPQTMEELTAFNGVGRKTASIILWACLGKNEGIAVDTHVMRLARRLGLSRHKTPQRIELDLMRATPRKEWGYLTTLIISHGRAVCTARNRQCGKCVFTKKCPSSLVTGHKDLSKN